MPASALRPPEALVWPKQLAIRRHHHWGQLPPVPRRSELPALLSCLHSVDATSPAPRKSPLEKTPCTGPPAPAVPRSSHRPSTLESPRPLSSTLREHPDPAIHCDTRPANPAA